MTKNELNTAYQEYLAQEAELDNLIITTALPNGKHEVCVTSDIEGKLAYINKTYNDDLTHTNCPDIRIEEAIFSVKDDDLTDFGDALASIRDGERAARKSWNGKGQYVFLAGDISFCCDADISEFDDKDVAVGDVLVLRNAQGNLQPGWIPSMGDLLADDWYVLGNSDAQENNV